jgi:hypothetical protein
LGKREEKAGGAAQELLHRLQVPGVGQNHLHLSLADGHGHSAIPEGIGAEEEGGGRRVYGEALGGGEELQALLLCQGLVEVLLLESLLYQDPAQEVPGAFLLHQGFF